MSFPQRALIPTIKECTNPSCNEESDSYYIISNETCKNNETPANLQTENSSCLAYTVSNQKESDFQNSHRPLRDMSNSAINNAYPTFNPVFNPLKSKQKNKEDHLDEEELEIQQKLKLYRDHLRVVSGGNENRQNSTEKLIYEFEQHISNQELNDSKVMQENSEHNYDPELLQLTESQQNDQIDQDLMFQSGNEMRACSNVSCQQFEMKQVTQITRLLKDKTMKDTQIQQLIREDKEKTAVIQDLQSSLRQQKIQFEQQRELFQQKLTEQEQQNLNLNREIFYLKNEKQQLNNQFHEINIQKEKLFAELQQLKKQVQEKATASSFYIPQNQSICDITYDHSQESIKPDQSFQMRNRRIRSLHEASRKITCGTSIDEINQKKPSIIEDLLEILNIENESQICRETNNLKRNVQKQNKFIQCIQDMIMKLTPPNVYKQSTPPTIKECWKWLKRILLEYMDLKKNNKSRKIVAQLMQILSVQDENEIIKEIHCLISFLHQYEKGQ